MRFNLFINLYYFYIFFVIIFKWGGEGKIYLNYEDVQSENDYFHPEREGFYSISILDEAGHSDTVNFRVVLDE